ncbi:MAG TPA: glycosyltransferase family 1 protein [Burkholderiales bacterium]|nr:glycosyltransferase family 1 protein [Burkholderiales bacterium]
MNDNAFIFQELPDPPSSLRVALVTETYPPEVNGVAMTIARIVEGLQRRNHRIQLIRPRQNAAETPTQNVHLEEVLSRGVPIPRYQGLRIGLPARPALLRLWSLKRPDVVHIATEGPLGWSALAAAVKLRLPVSSGFHTNFHSYSQHYGIGFLKKPIAAYLRRFHNRAQATLVPTEGLRRELAILGFENLRLVSRGVDTRLFSPAHRSPQLRRDWRAADGEPVALYVGRIAAEKNLKVVVSAFSSMRTRAPQARLVMVGDGPERATLAARHPDIVFAGTRTGDDLAAHYASADIFLFPSLTETFGNVTLEAMASGLAVVAYDYAAAQQYIAHERSGLLVPFDDGEVFIRLATALATDPRRAASLRVQARASAERIDWDNVFDDFEVVLREVIQRQEANRV